MSVLCSRVRVEEKRIFAALENRGVPYERIDIRALVFGMNDSKVEEGEAGVALLRCLSHTRALYAARMLAERGWRTVNTHSAIATCGDKVLTTMALEQHGVPTPYTAVAFSPESALRAMDGLGYPLVVKPPVGSWGRLMAKVNDREAAEAVIEHKAALGKDDPFYVQRYVLKPGRDIRTLVVGDQTICAVYRHASHWITNTARGGETSPCPLTAEIDDISRAAARAVGGEIVAVDLLEAPDGTLLVNEVNHTPEFHGAMEASDVDIAGKIAEYVIELRRDYG